MSDTHANSMGKFRSISSLKDEQRLVYAWIAIEEIVRDRKCNFYKWPALLANREQLSFRLCGWPRYHTGITNYSNITSQRTCASPMMRADS